MVKVGDVFRLDRRWVFGSRVEHSREAAVVRVTAHRAFFPDGKWFALDDDTCEVRPNTSDYVTNATPVGKP